MINIFFLLSLLFKEHLASLTITQSDIGCQVSGQSPCTKLCILGVSDCSSSTPVCEYGYFLFKNQYCVQCPYQDTQDPLTLYCMDCVENPYTWDSFRKCTYDYTIQNGDKDNGAYIKVARSSSELFFVGDALAPGSWTGTITRETSIPYQTFVCSSCDSFCNPELSTTQNCNSITSSYSIDSDKVGVICSSGSYYYQNLCTSCPIRYCANCTSDKCESCETGYVVSADGKTCNTCVNNCKSCSVNTQNTSQAYCDECTSSSSLTYVVSLDRQQCEACGDACMRCEYVTYVSTEPQQYPSRARAAITTNQANYVKKCRQCSMGSYTISYNGSDCVMCEIRNCYICYYTVRTGVTTMDLDFEPLKTGELTPQQQCLTCYDGFMRSSDGYSCISVTGLPGSAAITNCKIYKQIDATTFKCWQCQENYILDQDTGLCYGQCTAFIANCKYCYSYYSKDTITYIDSSGNTVTADKEKLFQCYTCYDGYYPDFFTGVCIKCQDSCLSCWQYTLTYNFTEYIQLQNPISEEAKQSYYQYTQEPVYCSSCKSGYLSYSTGVQCLGCSNECTISNPSKVTTNPSTLLIAKCVYDSEFAYCAQCFNYFRDRSLKSDLTECHECPQNCYACRDRNSTELYSVNPYFNPSSSSLQKFSKLCYSYDTKSTATTSVDYKSYLNMPIICSYSSGKPGKCIKKAAITVKVYCDATEYQTAYAAASGAEQPYIYSLQKFNSIYVDKQTILYFDKVETSSLYTSLNEQVIEELEFTIELVQSSTTSVDNGSGTFISRRVCSFPKTTYIQVSVHQNVFSIRNQTIIIKGAGTTDIPLLIQLDGYISIQQQSSIVFRGIELQYKYGQVGYKYFGIKIYNNQLTSLTFDNFIAGRYITGDAPLQMSMNNIYNLSMTSTQFLNLVVTDYIDFVYNKDSLTTMQFYFDNVKFYKLQYSNKVLFKLDRIISPIINLVVGSTGMIFDQCILYNASIIGESETNQYQTGKIDISRLVFGFTLFNQSSFLNLRSQNQTTIQNVDVYKCKFASASLFISNSLSITNLYVNYTTFLNSSKLIKLPTKIIEDAQVAEGMKLLKFNNLNFQSNECQNINCFIYIQTPSNTYSLKTNITSSNILINNTNSFTISQKDSYSVSSSLLYFKEVGKVVLKGLASDNNPGITILSINDCQSVNLDGGLHDWSASSFGAMPDDPNNSTDTPGVKTVLPSNNLLPPSSACATRKVSYKSFSQLLLYISSFQYGISISNVVIRRQISQDTNFIQLESWNVEKMNTTSSVAFAHGEFYDGFTNELIVLKDITLIGNSLSVGSASSAISSIMINSKQIQTIKSENLNFQDNHLHSLVPNVINPATPLIVFNCPLSTIIISNSYFYKNRATQIQYAIMYISASSVTMNNATFNMTNMIEFTWINRIEEFQFDVSTETKAKENLKEFFKILSVGGNAYIKADLINITKSYFLDGHAIQGTGLYLQMINSGTLTMSSTKFKNQFNNLEDQYVSKGGCLYIDSSTSNLTMTLDEVDMDNCVARSQGGCIHIEPSTLSQKISIVDGHFGQCQAIIDSFMDVIFSTSSPIDPVVSFTNCQFQDNQLSNFLRNAPSLSSSDKSYLLSSATVYHQQYGQLIMTNCEFSKFNYSQILRLETMTSVVFKQVQLQYNFILYTQFIYITLRTSYNTITINDLSLMNNKQYTLLTDANAYNQTLCNSYLSTLQTVNVATQVCSMLDYMDQVFRLLTAISANIDYGLYDAQVENNYKVLTNVQKYYYPKINKSEEVKFTTLRTYSFTVNYVPYTIYDNTQFEKCYYYSLVSILSTTQWPSTLFYLNTLTDYQLLNVSGLNIQNNYCVFCYGGLFQILNEYHPTTPNIHLNQVNCLDNTVGYYGCIYVTNQTAFTDFSVVIPITDFSVLDLTATRLLSVLSDLESLSHHVRVESSTFSNNKAKIGGGITLIGVTALITNSDFKDNTATLLGGSIFYQANYTSTMTNNLYLFGDVIQGSSAQLAGGIFIYGGALPNESTVDTTFSYNVGTLKGSNLEEYPQRLTLSMRENQSLNVTTYFNYSGDSDSDGFIDSTTTQIIDLLDLTAYSISNYPEVTTFLILPSGQAISTYKYYYSYTEEQVPFDWIFRIVNLDRYRQSMTNIDASNLCKLSGRIMDSNNYDDTKEFLTNFTSPTQFYFDTTVGQYNMDSLIIYFDPNSAKNLYLQLKVTCSSISIPVYSTTSPYTIQGYNTNYALYMNIRTFPCQLGEAYNQQQCKACTVADKTYSVDINSLQCTSMNSATMEDVTPVAIKLNAEYWRASFNNQKIEYCTNLPANCNGGWKPGNPSCYTGHMGALCESCDIYATRSEYSYSTSSKYSCGACKDTVTLNSIVITAMSLFTLISMALSVKGNYQMLEDFVREQRLIQMGILISNSNNNLAILIKLFTNYLQIVSSLTTFQLELPSTVSNAATVLGNPTQSMSYSLDCFLVGLTSIDILYFRMIWALVMPIFYMAVFFLCFFFGIAIGKLPYKTGIIYTTFIYMFIYLQPTLVGGFISLASSRYVGNVNWVQADVLYQYDTATHVYWVYVFVLPLLVAWALVLPLIFYFLVWNIKHALDDFENRKKLGYFYNEYTKEGYFWEFVKIFQKELIIIFLTFYEDRIVVKGLIIFLIIFFYGGFTVKFQPYSSQRLNFLDRLSTAICGASLCLGVLIYSSQKEGLSYLQILMFVVVGVLNIGFIILMVYYLLEGYLIKFQDLLDKVRDQIRINHPELQETHPWLRKALINRGKMNKRVKEVWSKLRYFVRQGIKRKRENPTEPLAFRNDDHDNMPIIKQYNYTPQGLLQAKTIGNESSPKNPRKVYPDNQSPDQVDI